MVYEFAFLLCHSHTHMLICSFCPCCPSCHVLLGCPGCPCPVHLPVLVLNVLSSFRMYCPCRVKPAPGFTLEVGIYKRKQESKKKRKNTSSRPRKKIFRIEKYQ